MKVINSEVFGQNLLRLRSAHRWSQRDLAQRIHVHQTMIARWETGKTTPRGDTIEKLAQALEVKVHDLMASEEEREQNAATVVNDPELGQLLSMVNTFEVRDREALKTFLEAIVMKNRVKSAVQQAS